MGDNLPFVDAEGMSGLHVVQVVCGWHHTCVIMSDNQIKCFGRNDFGQLGYGDTLNRGKNANEIGNALAFVNVTGTSGLHVLKVAAGDLHTCVLLSNNRVKCFGYNGYGELGTCNSPFLDMNMLF